MIGCPTGAIGRDPDGEVFIRTSLCTGCGHCAKACPWENIRMTPRQAGPGSAEIAVKCDLCRAYEAPACVESCPTGSLLRLDPSRDIAELGQFLGSTAGARDAAGSTAPTATGRRMSIWPALQAWALALALAGVPWVISMHTADQWRPGAGIGLVAGWLAGVLALTLAGYGLVKRGVKWAMRPRRVLSPARRSAQAREDSGSGVDHTEAANAARSRVRPHYRAHVTLGLLSAVIVSAHAGVRLSASPAGAALIGFWLVALIGLLCELSYRLVPARLSRLERRGALPEDLARERTALLSRLYRHASGADAPVKALLADVVIPYARSLSGALGLFLSGRTLAQEEVILRSHLARIHRERYPGARPLDMSGLIRIAVELRALPARRLCTLLLRAWLPLHMLASAVFGAALLLHVALVATGS